MKTYDMQPIIDFFAEQQGKLNNILLETGVSSTEIIYPTMDELAEWTFLVPENATKWECYVAGIIDCMNYIKANNEKS